MRKHVGFAVIGAMTIIFAGHLYAQEGPIEVENLGPEPEAPAQEQPFQGPTEAVQVQASGNGDADQDGVPDGKDECPDTPRLVGTYSIGETFTLEDLTIRYMGIMDGGTKLFQTMNISADEGGNLRCSIKAGSAGSCLIKGVPEVEIVMLMDMGNRVQILVRDRVDKMGCSPEM